MSCSWRSTDCALLDSRVEAAGYWNIRVEAAGYWNSRVEAAGYWNSRPSPEFSDALRSGVLSKLIGGLQQFQRNCSYKRTTFPKCSQFAVTD